MVGRYLLPMIAIRTTAREAIMLVVLYWEKTLRPHFVQALQPVIKYPPQGPKYVGGCMWGLS